jgi:hypothetical protein
LSHYEWKVNKEAGIARTVAVSVALRNPSVTSTTKKINVPERIVNSRINALTGEARTLNASAGLT